MTSDLKQSRDQAEDRRLFIETILADLAVGVIALAPPDNTVTSINPAAARILGIKDCASAIGLSFNDLLTPENAASLAPFIAAWNEADRREDAAPVAEQEVRIFTAGRELRLLCTAGPIIGAAGLRLGTVLLFDDVTELSKAQQMAAWREVARRVAHEIKNPLTPIQLSAQRLARLLAGTQCGEVVAECTQTIVEEVDAIKRLANEFSRFARMPTAEFQSANLNLVISDVVALFAEKNPRIVFQFIADSGMPDLFMDREQVRAVLVNIIENAVLALREGAAAPVAADPKIVVKTSYSKKRKLATIEISDNGPGIVDSEKTRIFEPYYTTRKDGTGLGLAIVTSIITDHQGEIRVYDNPGGGAKFLIDFPLAPRVQTQRRLGGNDDPAEQLLQII
jgi:two-component system nitrogen regulation sensor histidine kinase NtrY